MRVPNYVAESPDLLADREAEWWSLMTTHEEHACYLDLRKDWCSFCSKQGVQTLGPACTRIGVPEVYSHAYDAHPAPRLVHPELLQPRFGQWQREAM